MIVYANNFDFFGIDCRRKVFESFSGWLKSKTGLLVKYNDLISCKGFDFNGVWVVTESADVEMPYLNSILIRHSDPEVKGRQWIVEIGLKYDSLSTFVSIVVKVDDMSSLVSRSVFASRPKIVQYLLENIGDYSNVIGSNLKVINGSSDDYRGFLADILKEDRDYPIVVISPDDSGSYRVDPEKLQGQLVGLAQVVKILSCSNSYEMESIVGRNYSAWSGAINIINTKNKNDFIKSNLLQSKYLDEKFINEHEVISYILSVVTHNTNIPKIRRHINPDNVRYKSAKDRYEIRSKNKESSAAEDVEEILELAASQEVKFSETINEYQLNILELQDEIDALKVEISGEKWKSQSLIERLSNVAKESGSSFDFEDFLKYLISPDLINPEVCLTIISRIYSDNLVVLDSAYDSARKVDGFKRSSDLLDMLSKLICSYLPLYMEGGDNKARFVFTNNQYAANESETVVRSSELSKAREFTYEGKLIHMWQHLRVGIADNSETTIRVHFYVDKSKNKIVIGHCGEHLPL